MSNAIFLLKAGSSTDTPLDPTRIVLHAIAEWVKLDQPYKGIQPGTYYAPEWLKLEGYSYHALFSPSGVVIKCRPENRVAYHAKADGHNFKALGGAFMVSGVLDYGAFLKAMKEPYLTEKQYEAGIRTVRQWTITHNINKRTDIVTHSAIDPTKKQDPGEGFPLFKFIEAL